MRYQTLEKLKSSYWYSFSDEPVATRGSLFIPRLSDPSFLLPEESPDGLWHLFAHTWLGLEHYTSTSGLEWERAHLIFTRGHSPFIYKEGSTYYLLYETHDKEYFSKKNKNSLKGSRIMLSSSTDLSLWSEPKVLLEAEHIAKAVYRNGAERISRPQLVQWNGRYRLYFGAGEVLMYDTKQKTTASLMYADSDYIDGPYTVDPKPIIEVNPDSKYRNLSVGSVRIVPCADGLAAIECAYSYAEDKRKSTTNLLLLTTLDGVNFSEPIVIQSTPEEGWASRYITSVDLRYKDSDEAWYCYYSANSVDKEHGIKFVKESLGLLIGKDKK